MNSSISKNGLLLIVSTPIGNLGDISERALQTLRDADYVLAEDTRRARQLLTHFAISQSLVSCHEHNERKRVASVLNDLAEGKTIALISDAGTPLINDPGYQLVSAVRQAGYKVSPIPGASSIIAALCVSGLPTDQFFYQGFLPAKSSARKAMLESFKNETYTVVFLESTHRIVASVQDMLAVLGESRQVTLARELTKQYETIVDGDLSQILAYLLEEENHTKGEFVVMIAGAQEVPKAHETGIDPETLMSALLEELPVKPASKVASKLLGIKRNQLYDLALKLKDKVD